MLYNFVKIAYESLTRLRKNGRFYMYNNLILLRFLLRGSMTVLDQGSWQYLAKDNQPLTTLPPSSLMIPMFPQPFHAGRVCALLGRRSQATVLP
jgi:hypothetical protein